MNLKDLSNKFAPADIEWRIGRSGLKADGTVWALALAYVTNRAIMDRLDEVCGPGGWQNEFAAGPSGGVICGISIAVDGEWVTKWDGAENTKMESVKGGLSGSMKRAGVQWSIGRYLYGLTETFVDTSLDKKYANRGSCKANGSNSKVWYTWKTPRLPEWAMPKGAKQEDDKPPTMDFEDEPEATVPKITEAQIVNLMEIIESKGWNVKGTLKKMANNFGHPDVESLPLSLAGDALKLVVDLQKKGGDGETE